MASGVMIPESGEVSIPSFPVLGIQVHALQIPEALRILDHWIRERKSVHCVAQVGMHGSAEAIMNPKLREIINSADLKNMDGTPMRWLARIHGFENVRRRVCGPELMGTLLRETGPKYKHFFYGNQASEKLSRLCAKKYGTRVAGIYPLPIWPLPETEKEKITHAIESVSPDIVWVGLGTPRQERWMFEFRNRLTVPVLAGVGAAFDFLSGRSRQAPIWMQEHGLEWFYRLSHEPKRLWRRYLVCGPRFMWNAGLELAGLKKFD
ncbi:MAG TPA: WecB/TagA/CpsF family glycosyltransferase [Candidatus Dormibacteraeota bacterium]|jgi:N-acetylglucosaminyldiphosphoundecaprenol N-acetyl-beta-D-mannosaminyltransferase|nr:WecB/TagA/CpsF family glycosyltransferase [Candidatus Dormibacteraeota bacterium]